MPTLLDVEEIFAVGVLRTEPQLRGSRGEEREIVRVGAEAVRKSCG